VKTPAKKSEAGVTRGASLVDQVYELLWEKICLGEISPGERLRDVEWSERLSVSRTPVREAMRKLEQDRILVPAANGFQVRQVNPDDLNGLYEARAEIEALAAKYAALIITEEQILELEEIIERVDFFIAKNQFQKIFDLNTQFHDQLIDACKNENIIALFSALRKLILFNRASLKTTSLNDQETEEEYLQSLVAKQNEHRALVKALRDRDGEVARRIMRDHLIHTVQVMQSLAASAALKNHQIPV